MGEPFLRPADQPLGMVRAAGEWEARRSGVEEMGWKVKVGWEERDWMRSWLVGDWS